MQFIDYQKYLDEALHSVVKRCLEYIVKYSMPEGHLFYISFLTQLPGVSISPKLRKNYPEEMTIVLQYQYEDLLVFENYFSVKLSFDGIRETITIPYIALTSFADPNGDSFGLKFDTSYSKAENFSIFNQSEIPVVKETDSMISKEQDNSKVVDLASFRDKLNNKK